MKTTLTVKTPHGTFTRSTDNAYTHVVVRVCSTSKEAFANKVKGGVYGRWAKDEGFMVSWHKSYAAAQKASLQAAAYDLRRDQVLLGIYAVGAEAPQNRVFLDFSGAVKVGNNN
jgi:hypothetical protein